jgi:two-component system OmpR family response regulator
MQPGVEPLRAQRGAASAGRPHVVAVVDFAVRGLLRDYLGQNGFRVTAVPHGAGMREVLAADVVDLLVLGDKPGSDDGLTLARRVHGISESPGRRCARV